MTYSPKEKKAIEELRKNSHVVDGIPYPESVTNLNDVIHEYDSSVTINPRKKTFSSLESLKKDMKHQDKGTLTLYSGGSLYVNYTHEEYMDVFSELNVNAFISLNASIGNGSYASISYLLEKGKEVQFYRRKVQSNVDGMSGIKTGFNDPLLATRSENDILYFRNCKDIATYPVTDGMGIVSANDFTFEEDHLLSLKKSKAPLVILDSSRLGFYLVHPNLEKITYQK